jgi:hypothetical protein
MRCSDGHYYVVKFQNNPQGLRILANEMLGMSLASRLDLRVPGGEIVSVSEELVGHCKDLSVQLGRGRQRCHAGLQFGSRYPARYKETPVFDVLPTEQLGYVSNLSDFLGMLVFDKWTCNTDGRQAIFICERETLQYSAYMIDNGFCFNAIEWTFPDAPLRGLYSHREVYESVRGMKSFASWIERVERINESVLEDIYSAIPPEWYGQDFGAIEKMLARLLLRRRLVPELIVSSWKCSAQPFPNWT